MFTLLQDRVYRVFSSRQLPGLQFLLRRSWLLSQLNLCLSIWEGSPLVLEFMGKIRPIENAIWWRLARRVSEILKRVETWAIQMQLRVKKRRSVEVNSQLRTGSSRQTEERLTESSSSWLALVSLDLHIPPSDSPSEPNRPAKPCDCIFYLFFFAGFSVPRSNRRADLASKRRLRSWKRAN